MDYVSSEIQGFSEVSFMFSTGEQQVFTGGQEFLDLTRRVKVILTAGQIAQCPSLSETPGFSTM